LNFLFHLKTFRSRFWADFHIFGLPFFLCDSQGRLLPNEVETETGPILNFNSVGRQEAGRYQCTASNGVGQPAILTFDLHVLCK
jgi:hypothetical protein